eukprot:TRINITY_DN60119_c0_g1_i1.p4 TRINITY_DN60119_c0_g1~~TRINITY_DN60119_c0_g1_i1.p4  ORF type:complete len:140 (+),score=14.24 TRINITY_DN60119_c0_g1_i1:122-541(+)
MEEEKYYEMSKKAATPEEVGLVKKILTPAANKHEHSLQCTKACNILEATENYVPLKPMAYTSSAVAAVLGRIKTYLLRKDTVSESVYSFFRLLRNILNGSDDTLKELQLTLIFNLSRALADSDIKAANRATLTVNESLI